MRAQRCQQAVSAALHGRAGLCRVWPAHLQVYVDLVGNNDAGDGLAVCAQLLVPRRHVLVRAFARHVERLCARQGHPRRTRGKASQPSAPSAARSSFTVHHTQQMISSTSTQRIARGGVPEYSSVPCSSTTGACWRSAPGRRSVIGVGRCARCNGHGNYVSGDARAARGYDHRISTGRQPPRQRLTSQMSAHESRRAKGGQRGKHWKGCSLGGRAWLLAHARARTVGLAPPQDRHAPTAISLSSTVSLWRYSVNAYVER